MLNRKGFVLLDFILRVLIFLLKKIVKLRYRPKDVHYRVIYNEKIWKQSLNAPN